MTKKSSSKAASKPKANESAEHYHNDLIKRIAELEAEVASLKKQSSSQSSGGEDPRVNILWEALERMGKGKYLK
tara:strand:+ start:387 stop:608 length:222 start_codon:yes stop_codon:yes gene_type:complete